MKKNNMKPHLVVLSGAGISAESGLKTFRDSDGLWMGHRIEDVATPRGFAINPERVLEFYNLRRREIARATPNLAHIGIAELEERYRVTVITQNIDDLHERAGSSRVLHLHGEIFKMCSCEDTSVHFDIRGDILPGELAPDGGQLRPSIVWFEEPVPLIPIAAQLMSTADFFLLVGTSLQVYPAASLVDFLPVRIPKFIVDKRIPPFQGLVNVHLFEMPATEGIAEVSRLLAAL